MGEADDFLHRINRAHGIGGVSDSDQLCVLVQLAGQVLHVEGAVFVAKVGPSDRKAAIFGHEQPRGDVGVVIEAGEEDFVAGLEFAAKGARDGEGKRRHVGAEDDFVGAAVQEVGHGSAGFGDHRVSVAAGGVGSAGVGIVVR